MAEAERKAQLRRALSFGAITDADDLEFLGEPTGHALHHVGDERASESMERAVLPLVVRALDDEFARRPDER